MSLITSCPSCGTKFRVVTDQLRISEGWVRCGRCQMVFDAQQTLQQRHTLTPSVTKESAVAPESAMPASLEMDASHQRQSTEAVHPELLTESAVHETPSLKSPDKAKVVAVANKTEWTALGDAAARLVQEQLQADKPVEPLPSAQSLPAAQAQIAAETDASESRMEKLQRDSKFEPPPAEPNANKPHKENENKATKADSLLEDDAELPDFVKQAQRRALWSNPWMRFILVLLALLLLVALAAQIAFHQRNFLLAWKPQWRPQFEVICNTLKCELAPYQNIGAVVLTGSAFTQTAQPHHYTLDLSIKNQEKTAVATPAVELTLTDVQDQVLVRKVLSPTEIGAPAELAAGSEWSGKLPVATQGLNLVVTGYRVTAFYP